MEYNENDMAIVESGWEKNGQFYEMMEDEVLTDDDEFSEDEMDELNPMSNEDNQEQDKHCRLQKLIAACYFHLSSDRCMKSCNFEHENITNPRFRRKVKKIMKILHNDAKKA